MCDLDVFGRSLFHWVIHKKGSKGCCTHQFWTAFAKVLAEYVWLDADGVTRSKTMTMTARCSATLPVFINCPGIFALESKG